MNNRFRWLAIIPSLILFIAAVVCPAEAKAQTDTIGSSVKTGFNAMAYRLQKIPPFEHFPQKRLFDHMFVTLDAAPTWTHHSEGQHIGGSHHGMRASLSVGDWFTPVHGARISLAYGDLKETHNVRGQYFGIGADYLMNLTPTPVATGIQPAVELIGVAGLEYQHVSSDLRNSNVFGAHVGIQARWNLTPATFIYMEPRFGLLSDNVDNNKNWQGYDWQCTLMFGVGYHMDAKRARNTAVLDNRSVIDNTFYGFSAGILSRLHPNIPSLKETIEPVGSAYIGKWTSSISGWRLMASTAKFGGPSYGHFKMTTFEFDYLFNINSAINGLNPGDRFNTNIIIGPTAGFNNVDSHKLRWGAVVGLQGVYNITNNLQVVLEPKATIFGNKFAPIHNGSNTIGTLSVGLQYRLGRMKDGDKKYDFSPGLAEFLYANNSFLSIGFGIQDHTEHWPYNFCGSISFGKWISTVSAWRFSLNGDFYDPHPYTSLTFSGDYMLSLGNMFLGYNPDRKVDVMATAGVFCGASHDFQGSHFLYGEQAGLQLKLNASKNIDVFFEPQFISQRCRGDRYALEYPSKWRFMLGVNYKFDNARALREQKGDQPKRNDFKRNYFVLTAGPGLFSESVFSKDVSRVTGAVDLAYGYRFTEVSAFQLGVGYDFIGNKPGTDVALGSAHIDYVFDMTQFMSYDPDRRFHVCPVFGFGLGWTNYNNDQLAKRPSKVGTVAHAGIQFKWVLNDRFDVFVMPQASFYQQKLMSVNYLGHYFAGTGKLLVGGAIKF